MSNIKPIVPTTIKEAWEHAKFYYTVDFIKKNHSSPSEVFYVINLGLELDLSPAQALQNIAIINGKPTVWGDLLPGLILRSGLLENLKETIEGSLKDDDAKAICIVKRKNLKEVHYEFSTEDAKRAGLWKYETTNVKHQKLPWATYPLRMLKMRARTFALRDNFPDLLKGLTSREEATDYVDITPSNETLKMEPPKPMMIKAIPPKNKEISELAQNKTSIKDNEMESLLLGECYVVSIEDKSIHFESGIVYSSEEILKAKAMTDAEKKKYHLEKLETENGNHNLYKQLQQLKDIAEV